MNGSDNLRLGQRPIAAHDAYHNFEKLLLGSHQLTSLVPAKPVFDQSHRGNAERRQT